MPTYTTNNGVVWHLPPGRKRKGLKKRIRNQVDRRQQRQTAIEERQKEREERELLTRQIKRMYRPEIQKVKAKQ